MTTAMKSMTVTYHAPPGDSKVTEAFGHTFFDGKSEQIEVPENVAEKLRGNRHFQCSEPQDAKPKDTKATKADEDGAKRADAEKTAAQLPNPPQRGAVLNPDKPEETPPPSFPEGEKAEAHHDKHEAHKAKT